MSWVLLAALAAAPATLDHCSWDRPGHNPFMGNVVAAVDRYADIPADVRARLKARMQARQYDEMVSIRRDTIVGQHRYDPAITGMHFGAGSVCQTVSRTRWNADMQERGLVYCESGHCILVPTVCRNVSRISRRPAREVAGAGGGIGAAGGGAPGVAIPDVAWMGDVPVVADAPVAAPTAPVFADATPPPTEPPRFWTLAGGSFSGGGGPPGGGGGGGGSFKETAEKPPGGDPGPRQRTTLGDPPPPDSPFPRPPKPPYEEPPPPPVTTPVPEPGSWALMALGLAIAGAAARRQRGPRGR